MAQYHIEDEFEIDADAYWDMFFDLTERVKLTFDEEGVSIPFPQRDVHLHQAS